VQVYSKITQEEQEEDLFKADAVDEEDSRKCQDYVSEHDGSAASCRRVAGCETQWTRRRRRRKVYRRTPCHTVII